MGDTAALERVVALEQAFRAAEAELVTCLGEAEESGLAAALGYGNLVNLQNVVCGVPRGEAGRRIQRFRALASGGFAATSTAYQNGEVSGRHVDTITKFHSELSETANHATWPESEITVAEFATAWDSAGVGRFLRNQVGPRIDPDGTLPQEKELAEPQNHLSFTWLPNGWLHYKGALEPGMAALWASQVESFMYRHNESVEGLDFRAADQVRGHALAELTHVGFDGVRLPATGGERPQLVVSIKWQDLVQGLGTAALGADMLPISASEARRLACDCNVLPIVMDSESKPLDIGQSSRNIPVHIRRLVTDRDRGCSFPGCARPPTRCQIHHVIEWQHGGDTADHNLAMLCGRHHRIIHHSDWEVRMTNNHSEFLPPSYLDPRAHHRSTTSTSREQLLSLQRRNHSQVSSSR